MLTWEKTIRLCREEKWEPARNDPTNLELLNPCHACKKADMVQGPIDIARGTYVSFCNFCPIAKVAGRTGCKGTPFESLAELLEYDKDMYAPALFIAKARDIVEQEILFLQVVEQYCKKEGI